MNGSIVSKVIDQMQELPEKLQRQVLDYVQSLKTTNELDLHGKQILEFAGSISREDLDAMEQAVNAECESIDLMKS
jgi:hypothetical protein